MRHYRAKWCQQGRSHLFWSLATLQHDVVTVDRNRLSPTVPGACDTRYHRLSAALDRHTQYYTILQVFACFVQPSGHTAFTLPRSVPHGLYAMIVKHKGAPLVKRPGEQQCQVNSVYRYPCAGNRVTPAAQCQSACGDVILSSNPATCKSTRHGPYAHQWGAVHLFLHGARTTIQRQGQGANDCHNAWQESAY